MWHGCSTTPFGLRKSIIILMFNPKQHISGNRRNSVLSLINNLSMHLSIKHQSSTSFTTLHNESLERERRLESI
ncbi:hypothetical protein L1887_41826 [Cichorium endivia]|nr:hypothetical protein L1887_41826 [Cichorium endivia]